MAFKEIQGYSKIRNGRVEREYLSSDGTDLKEQ